MSTNPNECSYCGMDHGSGEPCSAFGESAHYAEVSWDAEDVRTLRPDLTAADADAFLERNERHLRDRLIEVGWEVIGTLLDMDAEIPPPFKIGDRVYWTDPDDSPDPDGGTCSGPGVITAIGNDPIDAETIIAITKDDGSEVEALPNELTRGEGQQ